ncbi:hypothetical protein [Acinetobacter sp. ANC 5378]|uniref:hypothetical protein n=1 Tax=Acinetobacter sp. ANC 5378 TaxID=2731249 RepID=UPI00148FAB20|nr:hypothetical protein [Acinetobacter sp. ANC 5378]NNG82440.1 hypothetical protein [Acinetobacter sp. ANC 5378]
MKKLILLVNLVITIVLSGCSVIPMKNSISFQINDHLKGQDVVYKNNWPECGNLSGTPDAIKKQKYITTYSRCKVSPEGYVPKQIIIEYAPWLTMEQVQKTLGEYPQKALSDIVLGFATEKEKNELEIWNRKQQELIEKIPATAWKQIVLTPPKEVKKYKYQVPEGKGNRSRGKEIHYLISPNPDGSYDIKTKLYWVSKYHKFWN